MDYNVGGFILLSVVTVVIGVQVANRRGASFAARLLLLALAARVLGSFMRYEVMQAAYGIVGDAQRYYTVGQQLAERLWGGELSLLAPAAWTSAGGAGGGTRFIEYLSGLVLAVIGPSLRAEFLVFALLAFCGLYWIAVAFARARSRQESQVYASIVWFWPSLFFWPSSVGKEAILLFGLGLATLGFVGRNGRYGLTNLAAGLIVLFLLRPHVALIVGGAMGVTHWLFTIRKINAKHVLEGVAVGALAGFLVLGAADRLGIEDLDIEGVSEFVAFRSGQTQTGGGNLGAAPTGALAVPMAFVNVWARPFVWEAHNATALLASLEVVAFWLLMFAMRRRLLRSVGLFRVDRLATYVIVLLTGYTLALGLTFANLGILARQRTPLLAFFLMLPLLAPADARAPQWEVATSMKPSPRQGAGESDAAPG